MGADGHVKFIEKNKVPEEFKDLRPTLINWTEKVLFGHTILWSYWDTNGYGDPWDGPQELYQQYTRLMGRLGMLNDKNTDSLTLGNGYYKTYINRRDINIELEGIDQKELEKSKRYWDFAMFLEGNSEDWEVWT